MPIEQRRTLGEWVEELERAVPGLQKHLAGAMHASALEALGEARKNLSGLVLKTGGGDLKNSVKHVVETPSGGDGSYGFGLRSASPYAAIHEKGSGGLPGGVIVPKRAQYLAIPLSAEAKRLDSPREQDDLFAFTSKKGNLLLGRGDGAGGLEPHWLLRRSVKMPKRPWMEPAMAVPAGKVEQRVRSAVRKALGKEG